MHGQTDRRTRQLDGQTDALVNAEESGRTDEGRTDEQVQRQKGRLKLFLFGHSLIFAFSRKWFVCPHDASSSGACVLPSAQVRV